MVRSRNSLAIVLLGAFLSAVPVGIAAADDSNPKWIAVAGGEWQPSADDLAALEQALKSALPLAAKHRGRVSPWDKYWFQYQGQKSADGAPIIHVNAFCDAQSRYSNLNHRWLYVSGGGACYFQADYDQASSRLANLMVNNPQ